MNRQGRGMRGAAWTLAAVATLLAVARPASAIRVLSYNCLLYPGTTGPQRDPHFQAIIAYLNPDVVMTCEIADATAAAAFLNNVLNVVNPGAWAQHAYFDCGDRDQCLFYKTAVLQRFSVGTPDDAKSLSTTPRLTPRWRLRPQGYTHSSNQFYIYGCHLKSSNQPGDPEERAAATAIIRSDADLFPPNTRFIVCGDLNLYTGAEQAYMNLLESTVDNDGRTVDPLNPSGIAQNWSGSFTYRFVHSQSPRTSNPPGQGGGVLGGLDDRFDFMLLSTILNGTTGISYVPSTYRTIGQDGARFNLAVNSPLPNGDVPDSIADDLWYASDHLPVMMELQYPSRISLAGSPLAFGTVIVGAVATMPLTVTNTAPLPGETLTYQYFSIGVANFTTVSGLQSEPAGGGSNVDTVTMNTSTPGVKDQAVAINTTTNARETPVISIPATGTVLGHGAPSTQSGSVVLSGAVDFGTHPAGGFSNMPAVVYDANYGPLLATVEVYDAMITGPDAARFMLVTSPPASAGASPASFDVAFDSSGAANCAIYSATLTLKTRDQQNLAGATNLADVTYTLTARVGAFVALRGDLDGSSAVDCGDISLFVSALVNPASVTQAQLDAADMNVDCKVDGGDVQGFEAVLSCP
ncbi:MAG: endonuclease/exonuclease/phosphatase family protein [Phycisphaerae bacterium]